jgi:HTH-type transcriptional regulator, glycine betaine synthesis regulator
MLQRTSNPRGTVFAAASAFCSFSIEQPNSSGILNAVKRNPIETVETADGTKAARLNPVEVDVIHLFVQLSRALNQPPSVAEIYGLLFISPKPLPQDDFPERLNLSKGSASQGLRYLMDLGAVRTVYVAGDRRVHYEAVAELRNLVNRFLRQQVLTYFDDSGDRLDRIQAEVQELPDGDREFALSRVRMLRSWSKNAKRLLPLVLAILGGRDGKNGK